MIFIVGTDQVIRIWNLENFSPVAVLKSHSKQITSVRFSTNVNDNYLLSTCYGGEVTKIFLSTIFSNLFFSRFVYGTLSLGKKSAWFQIFRTNEIIKFGVLDLAPEEKDLPQVTTREEGN